MASLEVDCFNENINMLHLILGKVVPKSSNLKSLTWVASSILVEILIFLINLCNHIVETKMCHVICQPFLYIFVIVGALKGGSSPFHLHHSPLYAMLIVQRIHLWML